jgi:uncharacterized membrane protein
MKALPALVFVACHRLPERSFFVRGRQMPVCARCTGTLLGYLSYPLFLFDAAYLPLWVGLLLNVPALADGATQAVGLRMSTNILRLTTGLLSGVGQAGIAAWIGTAIAHLLLAGFAGR